MGTATFSKRYSNAPSKSMGIRLLPESGVDTSDELIEEGSITRVPLVVHSTLTPIEVSISLVMVTSPIGGTLVNPELVSPSNAATIPLVVQFLAPSHFTSPTTGCPPLIIYAYLC